ncbi:hypothetical protein [Vagococcus humatus]|uniref:Prepilin type IV endopeptidase peptidase domain-containing protein n=1 Tax=Vagococcus humatus TaxID=1889241 RepID=A0A3R9ZW84_9ENTE|nr:hypothetical protein [Vagococcus humatus]RST89226.1 hypothetical protein C7P63_05475 [Vagococcus humatus]
MIIFIYFSMLIIYFIHHSFSVDNFFYQTTPYQTLIHKLMLSFFWISLYAVFHRAANELPYDLFFIFWHIILSLEDQESCYIQQSTLLMYVLSILLMQFILTSYSFHLEKSVIIYAFYTLLNTCHFLLGEGDILLLAFWSGLLGVILTQKILLGAILLAGCYWLICTILKKKTTQAPLPFIPFLSVSFYLWQWFSRT